MFTVKENSFLRDELNKFINTAQSILENETIEDSKRERIEARLITTVSIVNKLEHSELQEDKKSTEIKTLIVEDAESMRVVLKQYLLETGFQNIDMAEDGHRALSMLKKAHEDEEPYSLVISDWEMPKMSGFQLLKKVRTDKDVWRTPFYLLTALGEKKYMVQALNQGVTGYLTKPINQKIISNKFKEYIV